MRCGTPKVKKEAHRKNSAVKTLKKFACQSARTGKGLGLIIRFYSNCFVSCKGILDLFSCSI